jgi:hypothetical protein
MALNDTKRDLWVAVDDYFRHFHLTNRLGYNDSQLRYTLTVHDDYRRMRDNYSGIKLVNDAKLVSNVIDMILQIDCYSDNANKDVHVTLHKEDVDNTLNLCVDQAGTCSGDLCNDY